MSTAKLYSFDLSDYEAGRFVATRYPATCAVSGDWVVLADSDEAAVLAAHEAAESKWAAPDTRWHHDFTVEFCDCHGATS